VTVVVPPVTVAVENVVVVVDIVMTAVDTVAVARMLTVDLGKINIWTRHSQSLSIGPLRRSGRRTYCRLNISTAEGTGARAVSCIDERPKEVVPIAAFRWSQGYKDGQYVRRMENGRRDFGTSLLDIFCSWQGGGMVQEPSSDQKQDGKPHIASLERRFCKIRDSKD
jgi:hypothetical protein